MLDLEKKRVILDASFVRGYSSDKFNWLITKGATLVFIDTLLYELCTTEKNAERTLLSVFDKLRPFKDKIEVWTHNSEMMSWEVDHQSPYGCPKSESITNYFKQLLQTGRSIDLAARQEVIKTLKKEREDSVPFMLSFCRSYRELLRELSEKIKSKQYQEISDICSAFICGEENIRSFIKTCDVFVNIANKVDDTWLVWHDSKALLAIICEGLRYEQLPDFDNPGKEVPHKWINNKTDIDYVVALSRADAIVTNDQMMYWFCKWMYGESKEIILPDCIPSES